MKRLKKDKNKENLKNSKAKKKDNAKVIRRKKKSFVMYPSKLLEPVGGFLKAKLKSLERRRKDIEKDDPFKNVDRITDNASPDTDAAEQFGHARSSALKEQVDRRIIQTKKALARIKLGKYGICEDCGEMIDTDRLVVYPEATLCANCQAKREK